MEAFAPLFLAAALDPVVIISAVWAGWRRWSFLALLIMSLIAGLAHSVVYALLIRQSQFDPQSFALAAGVALVIAIVLRMIRTPSRRETRRQALRREDLRPPPDDYDDDGRMPPGARSQLRSDLQGEMWGEFRGDRGAARQMEDYDPYREGPLAERMPGHRSRHEQGPGPRHEQGLGQEHGQEHGQEQAPEAHAGVRVVGYVAPDGEVHYFAYRPADGPADYVPPLPGSNHDTVALEIRGLAMGSSFNRWIVYYDEVRVPLAAEMFRKLCVVGLADGKVMLKRIIPGTTPSLFHLESPGTGLVEDQLVAWAAAVKAMTPR